MSDDESCGASVAVREMRARAASWGGLRDCERRSGASPDCNGDARFSARRHGYVTRSGLRVRADSRRSFSGLVELRRRLRRGASYPGTCAGGTTRRFAAHWSQVLTSTRPYKICMWREICMGASARGRGGGFHDACAPRGRAGRSSRPAVGGALRPRVSRALTYTRSRCASLAASRRRWPLFSYLSGDRPRNRGFVCLAALAPPPPRAARSGARWRRGADDERRRRRVRS